VQQQQQAKAGGGDIDPDAAALGRSAVNPPSGRIADETLSRMSNEAVLGRLDAVCFALLNKKALHNGGFQQPVGFALSLRNDRRNGVGGGRIVKLCTAPHSVVGIMRAPQPQIRQAARTTTSTRCSPP
jgi:hypothetical protein